MKVVVYGRLPPPVGGVTIFINNLLEAGSTCNNVVFDLFGSVGIRLSRYDAAIVNASHPLKRLFQLIVGKLYARHVYFTIHGGVFREANIFNFLALRLSAGVFCLNLAVKTKMDLLGVRSFLHTTIFRENVVDWAERTRPANNEKKVLFYINNDRYIDGNEVYGASFFYCAVKKIFRLYAFHLVVVDLSGTYRGVFETLPSVTYIDQAVDFKSYLLDSDIYVRTTSTDGMSVALLEAVLLGVPCLASDVSDRPGPVQTYRYGSESDFIRRFTHLLQSADQVDEEVTLTSIEEYVDFMRGNHELDTI